MCVIFKDGRIAEAWTFAAPARAHNGRDKGRMGQSVRLRMT